MSHRITPLDIHFQTHKETLHPFDPALFLENLIHPGIDPFGLSDEDRRDRRAMKTSRVVSRISAVVSTFLLQFLFLFVVLIHSSFSYLGITCGERTWTRMDSMEQDATSPIQDWTTDDEPTTYPTTSSVQPSLFRLGDMPFGFGHTLLHPLEKHAHVENVLLQ
jgi:hypothetical protein